MGSNSLSGSSGPSRAAAIARLREEDTRRRRRSFAPWKDQRREARRDRADGRRLPRLLRGRRRDVGAAVGTAAFREAPNGARVVEIAAELASRWRSPASGASCELAYLARPSASRLRGDRQRQPEHRAVFAPGRRRAAPLGLQPGLFRVAWKNFFADVTISPRRVALREQLLAEAAKASFMKGQGKARGAQFEEMAEVLFEPAETEGRVFGSGARGASSRDRGAARPGSRGARTEAGHRPRAPAPGGRRHPIEAFGYSALELTRASRRAV